MKIVFLDVDGVLNSSRSILSRTGPRWSTRSRMAYDELCELGETDKEGKMPYGPSETINTIDAVAVDLVNRLLRKSEAQLVLSTSHRSFFLSEGFRSQSHLYALNLYFTTIGIEHPIFDITPKLHVQRGLEVAHWLDEQTELSISHYVILDDAKEFHPLQTFVWCDPQIGFSAANYFECCKHLVVQESTIIF